MENFLVLNFLDDRFEATLIRADFAKKALFLISCEKEKYESKEKFKKIFRRAFPMKRYNVILALDSRRAFTGYWDIFLTHDSHREKINQADLENFVSQALWKIFGQGRKKSAEQLELNDLDSLLVDTRICDFRVDGHRVINPLNHGGSKIEINLFQTFTSRPFFDQITAILPKRAELSHVIESGVAAANLLSRLGNKKNFIFAKVMWDETAIFVARNEVLVSAKSKKPQNNPIENETAISFFDSFRWGMSDFYGDIGKEIAAEPEIAEAIANAFFRKEISPAFERKFEEIVSDKAITLLRGLANAAAMAKCDFIYLDFPPASEAALRDKKIFPKMIKPVSAEEIAEIFGFEIARKQEKVNLDFLSLAAIIEFYFLPQEDLLNHLAKRRMRWLTADN